MRKIILLNCCFLMAVQLSAQVVLTLQLPPLGLTIKPQLWQLSLINTSGPGMDVRIEMVMTDFATNQQVLSGSSRTFHLPRGIKQVQIGDVSPITYNTGNPGYPVDPNPDGFLPIGHFNICYTVIKLNSDAPEQMSEECVSLEVEPLSPPQLIIPLDNENVDITRPLFAWMPPSPINAYSSMFYDWILVEVQPTQSAADAIQQNIPLHTQQNVQYSMFQYPLSMPELDTSKQYAWRITAKNYTSPIANSEIWTFRVKKFQTDSIRPVSPGYFARLSREENTAFVVCNGVLRFEYLHEQNTAVADLQITDISNNQRKLVSLDSTQKSVRYGQNFVQIDLRENGDMVDKHMYLLELKNSRSEKWYLKFEFRKISDE